MALLLRRGTQAERDAITPAEGELIYTTDTKRLYAGDSTTVGGVLVSADAATTLEALTDTDLTGAANGNHLAYNSATSKWEPTSDAAGLGPISNLSDVNGGYVNGDLLQFDGLNFVPKTIDELLIWDNSLTANLTGNVTGNVTGNTTGLHTGPVDGDVIGSVFGDDSTLLVDGVNNKIVGAVDTTSLRTSETKIALGNSAGKTTQGASAVAVGNLAGEVTQGNNAVAIGNSAGNTTQGNNAVAIGVNAGVLTQGANATAVGYLAGNTTQGANSIAIGVNAGGNTQGEYGIAIGYSAGEVNQAANSIVLNATGATVENTTASSLVVKPIRDAVGTTMLMYDVTSGEVTHTASPAITGDFTGSVFGDDSTVLVDGVNNKIVGNVLSNSVQSRNVKLGSAADPNIMYLVQNDTGTTFIISTEAVDGSIQLSRNTLIGSTNVAVGSKTLRIYNDTAAEGTIPVSVMHAHNGTSGSSMGVLRARGTKAVPLTVAIADTLGAFSTAGYNGASYKGASGIRSVVDGAPESTHIPASIQMYNTKADQTQQVVLSIGTIDSTAAFTGPVKLAVFADDAARNTAVTQLQAGMIVFNTTGTKFQGYTGSAWVDLN